MTREGLGIAPKARPAADTFIIAAGEEAIPAGMQLADELRRAGLGGRVVSDVTGRSMKAQFRTANKSGASKVLILGESELKDRIVTVKDMSDGTQKTVARAEIASCF